MADRFVFGAAPIDYGPVFLRMPFGFHLAMDTLPSGVPRNGGFRFTLACFRLSLSCPFRLLHTFLSLRPARRYSRFWIQRSSSERRRDFNPAEQHAAQRTLQASPPLCPASVLRSDPCGDGPLGFLPLHRNDRFPSSVLEPGSSSRHLYAGHHLGSKQVAPRFIPKVAKAFGFDVAYTVSTLRQWFTCVRLPDPYMT